VGLAAGADGGARPTAMCMRGAWCVVETRGTGRRETREILLWYE
jgi:hypothetical protein